MPSDIRDTGMLTRVNYRVGTCSSAHSDDRSQIPIFDLYLEARYTRISRLCDVKPRWKNWTMHTSLRFLCAELLESRSSEAASVGLATKNSSRALHLSALEG